MKNCWHFCRIMKPMPPVSTITSVSVAIFQAIEKRVAGRGEEVGREERDEEVLRVWMRLRPKAAGMSTRSRGTAFTPSTTFTAIQEKDDDHAHYCADWAEPEDYRGDEAKTRPGFGFRWPHRCRRNGH